MSSTSTMRETERWISGFRHNQVQLTGKLPPEIWKKIVSELDHITVWSLRNTCRFSLGFCEIMAVARDRRNAWRPDKVILPQQLAWWGINTHRDVVKDLLKRTQFCVPCQKQRAMLTGEQPWLEVHLGSWGSPLPGGSLCSACKIQHPGILHTTPDREKINNSAVACSTTTCVGRQSSIPICDHVAITWDEIQQFSDSISMREEADRAKHQHHLVCRHPSHGTMCAQNTVPRALLGYCRTKSGGCIEIRMQWEAAIASLPTDDATGKPLSLSYSQLRSLISASMTRCTGSAPRLLCPHLRWDDNSLLRPFDPTYCSCLGARIPVLHDADRCRLRGLAGDCCLCRSAEYNTAGEFLPYNGEGFSAAQLASHKASCTDCGTWFSWVRRKERTTGEHKLWLKMGSVVSLDLEERPEKGQLGTSEPNPCDMRWLSRIDPASVPGHWDRDPGLKHLTWCDDSDCATSYRGRARTRILGQLGERANHPSPTDSSSSAMGFMG